MRVFLTALLGLLVMTGGCAGRQDAERSEDYGSRTIGAQFDDQVIENRARSNIEASDPAFADAHIVIVSFNGIVLLAGQVGSEELKKKAEDVVKDFRKVRRVHNELTVAGPSSLVARSNDAWLTAKIKAAMAVSSDVQAHRINVTTENGNVYLMGLMTRDEADRAVEVTSKVYGVQKIVKVFEYIN